MSDQNEIERIKRIRERQLRTRDPKAYDRKIMKKVSTGHRKKSQLTFRDVLKDIPGGWWGMLFGAFFGIVVAVPVSTVMEVSWAEYLGIVIVFACIVIGRVLGAVLDWRKEDHSKLVRRR